MRRRHPVATAAPVGKHVEGTLWTRFLATLNAYWAHNIDDGWNADKKIRKRVCLEEKEQNSSGTEFLHD